MRYGSVQYARALAALVVVLYHCITVMNVKSHFSIFEYGKYGVDLFFVVSGFIMVVTTAPKSSAKDFLMKRLVRIVPLYWFATFVLAAGAVALPAAFRSTVFDWERFALSLAFVPHYHAVVTHQIWPILIQGWTLNYEMYFYVLFAAALAVAPGRHVELLAFVLLTLISVGTAFSFENPLFSVYTSPMLFEFLLGIILGKAVGLKRSHILIATNVTLTIAAAAAVAFKNGGVDIARPYFVGFTVAALMGWLIWFEMRGVRFTNKAILLVANASFSIYLFHTFALGLVRFLGNMIGLDWDIPALDTATLIIGTVFSTLLGVSVYLIFEKPTQSLLRRKLLSRSRSSAILESPAK